MTSYHPYATIEKNLGETPLQATERLRAHLCLSKNIPLAYAGRLDPMATGTLLVLIGDECKRQTMYHTLDKKYEVELLLGIRSDTGDVLGIAEAQTPPHVDEEAIRGACADVIGTITLPYPHFSSRTVLGKPLHMWAIEKRLDEIEIPTKTSKIYALHVRQLHTITKSELLERVHQKIDSIPPVTDPRKRMGADFRRVDVRASWQKIAENTNDTFQIVTLTCTASSGTYMRSLCEHIGKTLGTYGLALSIHRTRIGKYMPLTRHIGWWYKKY